MDSLMKLLYLNETKNYFQLTDEDKEFILDYMKSSNIDQDIKRLLKTQINNAFKNSEYNLKRDDDEKIKNISLEYETGIVRNYGADGNFGFTVKSDNSAKEQYTTEFYELLLFEKSIPKEMRNLVNFVRESNQIKDTEDIFLLGKALSIADDAYKVAFGTFNVERNGDIEYVSSDKKEKIEEKQIKKDKKEEER